MESLVVKDLLTLQIKPVGVRGIILSRCASILNAREIGERFIAPNIKQYDLQFTLTWILSPGNALS